MKVQERESEQSEQSEQLREDIAERPVLALVQLAVRDVPSIDLPHPVNW